MSFAAQNQHTGLGDVLVDIHCTDTEAQTLLEKFYLPPAPSSYNDTRAISVGASEVLLDGKPQNSAGNDSPRNFLEGLTTAIAFSQKAALLLHAGAVISPSGNIYVFPGDSGSGKTTLSVGLALSGWQLLTDEILAVYPDHRVEGYLRPVHIRHGSLSALPLSSVQRDGLIATNEGAILPASTFNNKASVLGSAPNITIIFPRRKTHTKWHISTLSRAHTLFTMMNMNINGRNFQDNGFQYLAAWVRTIPPGRVCEYADWSVAADYLKQLDAGDI